MSQQIEPHILTKYKILKKIGSGAYGHVYKVIDRKTKKLKALKKNFDAFINSTDAQRTYRQIMFLMKLKHQNIIILEQVLQATNGKDIYLVFQFMDVDLHLLIRQNILEDKHKKYILYQIAKAMLYLHSAGLIHRDLKPSNILVNQTCDAKLCDFGLVRSIDQKTSNDKFDILTQYIATRWYRAPEILLSSACYSKEIDIWAFGCLLAEMVKGKPVFPGTSTINQLERVLMWTGPPSKNDIEALNINCQKQILNVVLKTKKCGSKEFFTQISEDCLDLIQKCLQFNPSKRIKIQDILVHPYLKQFYNKQQLTLSDKKIKISIDDNCRLSLKEYRSLIYEEIKKNNKNSELLTAPFNQSMQHQQSILYRMRNKSKKTIRTEQSDYLRKQSEKCQPKKKLSITYKNQSKTVNIKKNTNMIKRKSIYKNQPQLIKNNTKYQHYKQQQRYKKLKQQIMQSRKYSLMKQTKSNYTKQEQRNKIKRSITENDKKQKKMLNTYVNVFGNNPK